MLSAGVARKEGGFGPDFDHMALSVSLERPWLADVGFGDSFEEPLLLDASTDQEQGCGAFRIESDGAKRVLVRRTRVAPWEPQYQFTLQPREFADYAGMCLYHQSSPLSSFTRGRIGTLATPAGRVALSGTRLITTTRNGQRRVRLERVANLVVLVLIRFPCGGSGLGLLVAELPADALGQRLARALRRGEVLR